MRSCCAARKIHTRAIYVLAMSPAPKPPDAPGRRRGFLVGAAVGAALAAGTVPAGRRRASLALADDLLTELLGGGVDLHRLAGRWLDWWRVDGIEAGPPLTAAMRHLAEFDAPPSELSASCTTAVCAVLPAALASATPRGMVTGTWHVARMLDPDPRTAVLALAVVMASAAMLEGRNDFIADILGILRENDAPPDLVDAMVAIARDPRAEVAMPTGLEPGALATTTWVLRQVYSGGAAIRILADVRDVGLSPLAGTLLGALVGARDGVEEWPADWIALAGEDAVLRAGVAARL
jgi:hypothetical protein